MEIKNPSKNQLKTMAAGQAHAQSTRWGNINFCTRIKARSPESTFLVNQSASSWIPNIDTKKYVEVVNAQDKYLKKHGYFIISGSIGNASQSSASIEYVIERNYPNTAAMQQQLLFPQSSPNTADFKVIYTPNLRLPDFQNGLGILVDLEESVTRVFGSDYFGESKKGGLRMWNKWIYDKGGLALHAGCKSYRTANGSLRSMLIIGLSGTGKTTTTFTPHSDSEPIQDDFCAFFPNGQVYASENGCFAKTFGLDPLQEPLIYQGVTHPEAWLENVYVDNEGIVDFSNDSSTSNGRATFPLDLIPHGDVQNIPPLAKILILNKDFNIIPAMAKLNRSQAAVYFMLGETMGTSAGGSSEAGKALRVPGTNPFFPMDHALQGNRFMKLLEQSPDVEVYLMNTGHIGQNDQRQGGEKITIDHSRKLIEAMLQDTLRWKRDPDFGYEIVDENHAPIETILTEPRSFYERGDNLSEYENILKRVRKDRLDFLAQFTRIDEKILAGL